MVKSTVIVVDTPNFPCIHSIFASGILCLLCTNTWRMLCLLGEWISFIIILNLNTCDFNQTVICYIMINTKGILPSFILHHLYYNELLITSFKIGVLMTNSINFCLCLLFLKDSFTWNSRRLGSSFKNLNISLYFFFFAWFQKEV